MKTAVVYYSFGGNTRAAAEEIACAVGGDLIELKPKKEIPKSGFFKFFIGGMQASFGIKPKLRDFVFDEDAYDRIVLGTPVWSGKPASPTLTFLKKLESKEKIQAVFTFSGGGDNDKCMEYLNGLCPSIKLSASLAGKETDRCENNAQKLADFISAATNGEKNA